MRSHERADSLLFVEFMYYLYNLHVCVSHFFPGNVIWRTKEPPDSRKICRWCRIRVVCDPLPESSRTAGHPVQNTDRDVSGKDLRESKTNTRSCHCRYSIKVPLCCRLRRSSFTFRFNLMNDLIVTKTMWMCNVNFKKYQNLYLTVVNYCTFYKV